MCVDHDFHDKAVVIGGISLAAGIGLLALGISLDVVARGEVSYGAVNHWTVPAK